MLAQPEFDFPDIQELVTEWRDLYAERTELSKLADQIKEGPEKEAKEKIFEYLRLTGQDGVKLANGGGTVGVTHKTQVFFTDVEMACNQMLQKMKLAEANGEPLVNELITQKTPLKSEAMNWAEEVLTNQGKKLTVENLNEVLGTIGMACKTNLDLTYNKGKKND
jgi:hypothetical protein